eukprot:1903312-Pyramimonas_sp.AAC.1
MNLPGEPSQGTAGQNSQLRRTPQGLKSVSLGVPSCERQLYTTDHCQAHREPRTDVCVSLVKP